MNDVTAKNELPACPVETTLTLIGDKWKVLIPVSYTHLTLPTICSV